MMTQGAEAKVATVGEDLDLTTTEGTLPETERFGRRSDVLGLLPGTAGCLSLGTPGSLQSSLLQLAEGKHKGLGPNRRTLLSLQWSDRLDG